MLTRKDFLFKKVLVVFLNRGEKMRFRNDNLIVEDKKGNIKHQSTCYRLFSVFIVGSFTITTGLIQRAKRFGFSIVLLTHSFRVYETLSCQTKGNTLLRRKQYLYNDLAIARYLTNNKIQNQINTIRKSRQPGLLPQETINQLVDYQNNLNNAEELKSILGLEGSAARAYFKQIYIEFNWQGRKPRVKHDINNCLLDIGYTILFSFIEALLDLYGFDLYVGFYHQIFYQRKSLVCDLVEPFRCIIDYKIRKMNNYNSINPEDFIIINERYQLSYKYTAKYVSELLGSIIKYKEEIFLYIQQFYRSFINDKPIEAFPIFTFC
ncbi:MAG TPA: type V CRISPR-associated endonuclease Cas1 [Clostridiaceae bacterium]|nr:type V CRISPR-associated endonuclease Cas1 [Clostridiaceae bacterium]